MMDWMDNGLPPQPAHCRNGVVPPQEIYFPGERDRIIEGKWPCGCVWPPSRRFPPMFPAGSFHSAMSLSPLVGGVMNGMYGNR